MGIIGDKYCTVLYCDGGGMKPKKLKFDYDEFIKRISPKIGIPEKFLKAPNQKATDCINQYINKIMEKE